ncbi:Drug/Metabolite Transporter (DMT) Superfamily [Planoprotostelium fungivorum]|uniref:Drug/Metabolite Transporter (DMT) Superfamily n=1 Tax=Planoprotostelium fungivorum TaxID=1890364 RepID=A0A2P6NYA1_9EUKA|nr:Drug/Metabolite Transporter (DMT) Superfamily [Planoprotostelium fungivorum]
MANKTVFFIVSVVGIYASYLIFSIFQENISKSRFGPENEKFRFTSFLLFCQSITDVIIVKIEYSWIAAAVMGAMYCSNTALQYVSFPTSVLAKSCKPIPVMLMGLIVLGKKQTTTKYICVSLITGGIAVFMMAGGSGKHKAESSDSLYGLILLTLSLTLDGIIGPLQERVQSKYKPMPKHMMYYTNAWSSFFLFFILILTGDGINGLKFCSRHPELTPSPRSWDRTSSTSGPLQERVQSKYKPMPKHMMYYTNAWSSFFLFFILILTGDGINGLKFCSRHPEIIWQILAYSVTSVVGQNFIYLSLYYFGSLTTSIITTTRKFFTILISVIYFGNALSETQWLGVAIVFLGLVIDAVPFNRLSTKSKTQ